MRNMSRVHGRLPSLCSKAVFLGCGMVAMRQPLSRSTTAVPAVHQCNAMQDVPSRRVSVEAEISTRPMNSRLSLLIGELGPVHIEFRGLFDLPHIILMDLKNYAKALILVHWNIDPLSRVLRTRRVRRIRGL